MRTFRVALFVLVVGGTMVSAPSLYAGDRKVVSDQDGGLWCTNNACSGPGCCGGAIQVM